MVNVLAKVKVGFGSLMNCIANMQMHSSRMNPMYVLNIGLVVLVQSFMLLQCGLFYLRLRLQNKKTKSVIPLASKEALCNPISVIIPVLNEEENIESTIKGLCEAACDAENLRIMISDSGCTDKTMDIVKRLASSGEYRAKILTAVAGGGGRGGAICAGLEAAHVDGDGLLFFVHADTVMPKNFDAHLRSAFARPGVLMTAFKFKTDRNGVPTGQKPPPGMTFMEFTVNLRSRFFELPFGDQALAVTKNNLQMIGGFPELPMLEEYVMVQKFRKLSAEGAGSIVTLEAEALCSPRRWCKRPIWYVNAINQAAMIRYNHFNATPEDIYKFYYGKDAPVPRKKMKA